MAQRRYEEDVEKKSSRSVCRLQGSGCRILSFRASFALGSEKIVATSHDHTLNDVLSRQGLTQVSVL